MTQVGMLAVNLNQIPEMAYHYDAAYPVTGAIAGWPSQFRSSRVDIAVPAWQSFGRYGGRHRSLPLVSGLHHRYARQAAA
jgi:hypothetical protein